MAHMTSDWFVLSTAGGYVGRDENGATFDVPLGEAAAFATEDRAIHAQAHLRRATGVDVMIHGVDTTWVQHRYGTLPTA